MQETTLPQRLAKSAKDLAYATLTGANFELKDLRESKQAGSSTQISFQANEQSSGSVGSRSTSSSEGSGFRNRPSSIKRRQTEEDFDRFHRTNDFQTWQNLRSAASVESIQDEGAQYQDSDVSNNLSLVASATEIVEDVEGHLANMLDLNRSKSRSTEDTAQPCERKSDFSHTSALRRLNQIGAHLQNNISMQKLEHGAHVRSHVSMHDIASQAQVEQAYQVVNELRDPVRLNKDQKDRSIDDQHTLPSHRNPAARDKRPVPSARENEQDNISRQFHCPYYACHENMQAFSTSVSSSTQKPCVHVGCKFQTETSTAWVEHVHTPHHDLQGSS